MKTSKCNKTLFADHNLVSFYTGVGNTYLLVVDELYELNIYNKKKTYRITKVGTYLYLIYIIRVFILLLHYLLKVQLLSFPTNS